MKLLYATSNPGKVKSMTKFLEALPIDISSLDDISDNLIKPEETGKDPKENAIIKARKYYEQLKRPLFSCDSGLYFEEVAPEEQPGVFIRRVLGNDIELNDAEMVAYYSKLAEKYGGKLTANYRNSICLILDENTEFAYMGEDISSEKFYIVSEPYHTHLKGFPLDSLSVEIKSGKYYIEMEENEKNGKDIGVGLRKFFMDNIDL